MNLPADANQSVLSLTNTAVTNFTHTHTLLPTKMLMHVEHTMPYHTCIYNRLPEDVGRVVEQLLEAGSIPDGVSGIFL
jgi:hypothetical protein